MNINKINEFQNLELEYQILFTIFTDINKFTNIPHWCNSKIFYDINNAKIFDLLVEMEQDGIARDEMGAVVYGSFLQKSKEKKVNVSIIGKILANYTTLNFNRNLQIVKELHLKRQMTELLVKSYASIDNVSDVANSMDFVTNEIIKISNFINNSSIEMRDHVVSHRENLKEKIELLKSGERYEITTGLPSLNNIIVGWLPTELIVIGARPSMGKTAVTLQFLLDANKPVLFLSLEMGVNSLIDRYISRFSEINSYKLKTGEVAENELIEIENIYSNLEKQNIYIDDFSVENADYHFNTLKVKIKTAVKKYGIKAVFIDYLGLMEHDSENDNLGFGYITNKMKKLAKELNIAIILLHQLNRGVESRSDKKPLMSDLRSSGEIEQDADIIIMLYRDEQYYPPENTSFAKNEIEFLIRKNRQGALADLTFNHSTDMTTIFEIGQINKIKNTKDMPF